jgi:CRISPR/Cas system-associated protein Cas10 (large subunit of type III CRISPR-Cas system)
MTHKEIRKRLAAMTKERRAEIQRLMVDFDAQQREERMKLREHCAQLGHITGAYHDNGIGWSWYYCAVCEERLNVQHHSHLQANSN